MKLQNKYNQSRSSISFKERKFLIISEDEKSFPKYFFEFLERKTNFRNCRYSNPATKERFVIELKHKNKKYSLSNPKNNVKFAIDNLKNYEKIFCVFDYLKNGADKSFDEAINLAKNYQNIEIIDSNPAFEYWLYLHFADSDQQFLNNDFLILSLEKLIQEKIKKENPKSKTKFNYKKSFYSEDLLELLFNNYDIAKKRAIKFNKINISKNTKNPSTKMFILLNYFEKII